MVQQIHLLQTIEGKEKTLLLVAIANFSFSFFMILKVFIFPFLGVFNILRLLWNLFCFFCGEETSSTIKISTRDPFLTVILMF